MAYSDFKLRDVKKNFGLIEKRIALFEPVTPLPISNWLSETLDTGLYLALATISEKARSEFIVVPILFEIHKKNNQQFAIYSGENLDVDKEKGLVGECDFILSKGDMSHTIQTPIFSLVEAKKKDIGLGLGQCAAQMIGAKVFNEQEGNDVDTIFGCVTTGETWQFLKLENGTLFIDRIRYYIDDVETILGIFQCIIDYYKKSTPSK
ncbi:MAG: hypothetical protein B6242_14110 [Anaerolineaceae bacterium 4572_78]|nr:MAG: hypothetical protein B6242_14110 [Anaerolineaceae bacterium 4572_78]